MNQQLQKQFQQQQQLQQLQQFQEQECNHQENFNALPGMGAQMRA